VYLPFPWLLFFLVVAYSKNGWTYLIDQYIKRRISAKDVPFEALGYDGPSLGGQNAPKTENFGT